MKMKSVLTIILLVFVAASMVTLVIKQKTPVADTIEKPEASLVVYYFHGNKRCTTCKAIEALAKEAVESNFSKEIEQGHLSFKTVNVDIPENEHFIQDYRLTTKTVIVARFVDGKQVEWKNLERVWELVPDKPAYLEYVQSETRELMEHA